jgi:G6PDH family F420-dependent oxidoreductase
MQPGRTRDVTEIGIFLSSEEHGPSDLVSYAQLAEQAGFRSVLISDHYHPWIDRQGESPFVWSVIGAIGATTRLEVTTGVTCPTLRIHPAILAQAAATATLMCKGGFRFGVGSGEALNEHVLGDRWPSTDERLDMLEEAVDVMRKLWEGEIVSHDGNHYVVDNARIYSCPSEPPPVLVSGFGPKATSLAARIGDGYVNTAPDQDLLQQYRTEGGQGPRVGATKVCWGEDEGQARKLAFELWPTTAVPGELMQELPMPAHYEQAIQLVNEEKATEHTACGPDPEVHVKQLRTYIDAGYDEIFVSQIGKEQQGMLDFYRKEVLPRL